MGSRQSVKKIEVCGGVLYQGDCLEVMKQLPKQSVDLVVGSPPYEDVRKYGELDFKLVGEEWVAWMVKVVQASLRISRGLVALVVGHGKNGVQNWSAVPALLMADLKRSGVCLRNPLIYKRNGIMGSGGADWFRADYEWIICATNGGRLPWSDNVACGHPPKCPPGGKPSHRNKDGTRVSDKDRERLKKLMKEEGISQREAARRLKLTMRHTSNTGDGDTVTEVTYVAPEKSNPGNVIDCGAVGGGHLGSNISHENDAPYPEKIPDFLIRSCCPPGGIVFDPFMGSGTTIAVAIKTGRKFIGCDLRESQVKLTKRRINQAQLTKGFGL